MPSEMMTVTVTLTTTANGTLSPRQPPLDFWKLLLRLAPNAKLDALADALYEQGYTIDMIHVGAPSSPEPTP